MATRFQRLRLARRGTTIAASLPAVDAAPRSVAWSSADVDIAPHDPLIAFVQSASGAVDLDNLEFDSPALVALRSAGVKLIVPLVSQGELIGLLNLGPRLSDQEYSADDRSLLNRLAAQAAPAVRVAQLVQEQQELARQRERVEHELRVAQLIQQQFLPKELPSLPGWQVAAHYQPARAVGGDFYDVMELPGGLIGIVAGDVTDKGVPAALVMASTRSLLRADAPRLISPAAVLERANDLLHPSIPAHMFVTCIYAVLDPASGHMRYANAGHNLPYLQTSTGVAELRATGMPLGLMPGMSYDEKEAFLEPGQTLLLYSDGLIEAHSTEGEMFGFPRLASLMEQRADSHELVDQLLTELDRFTPADAEQEDDITLVALHWSITGSRLPKTRHVDDEGSSGSNGKARILADFTIASEPGNERIVMERVADAVAELGLSEQVIERIKTAASEATMNAMEHGNGYEPESPVDVRVIIREAMLSIQIRDQGGTTHIPIREAPDIDLKLAGQQTPRGWGLFLIENMVDEMRRMSDGSHHTMELIIYLKGRTDANAIV